MDIASSLQYITPRQVYYLPAKWCYMAFLFLFLGAGLGSAMSLAVLTSEAPVGQGTLVFVLASSMLFFDLCLLIMLGIWRIRLELSPEGIEYHTLGWSIQTSWDNVVGVEQVRYPRQAPVEALLLKAPASRRSWWLDSFLFLQPLMYVVALLNGRPSHWLNMAAYEQSIPIGYFDPAWTSGPLGNNLRQYAPQLFGKAASPAAPRLHTSMEVVEPARAGIWPAIIVALLVIQIAVVVGLTWHWSGGQRLRTTWSQEAAVRGLALSADGQMLAVTPGSAPIDILQLAGGTRLHALDTNWSDDLALSPDGRYVVPAIAGGKVAVLRISDGALVHELAGHTEDVTTVAVSPDSRLVASGSEDGTVRLWRLANGELLHTLDGGKRLEPFSLQLPDSWLTGVITHGVTSVSFSPDGRLLASGADLTKGGLRLWQVEDGTLLRTLPTGFIDDVAFSADGELIAATGLDEIQVWRVKDGSLVWNFQEPGAYAASVAFSPDGRLLALGWSNGRIQIKPLAEGATPYTLRGHEDRISHLIFTPDSQTLISASGDKTIRLWAVDESEDKS